MAFYNESKFHMWRGCIAAVWIDGVLAEEELNWVMNKIETLRFTEEQKIILLSDLKGNINFKEIVSKISDKRDMAFLAYQIKLIGHMDKDFSENEAKLYKSWNEIVLGGVDLEAMEEIIAADEKASYHENEVYKVDNKGSIFEGVLRGAQKILNEGDYKYPEKK